LSNCTMECLRTLATSLESNNSNILEENEKNIARDFRAAAFSMTTLYKSAIEAQKKSFDSGYSTALHDILNFIQQGVSNGHAQDDHGMTIGKVLDFAEARLEAIGAQEDDIQSDNDKTVKGHRVLQKSQEHASQVRAEMSSTTPTTTKEKSPPASQPPPPLSSKRDRSTTPMIRSASSSPNIRPQPLPLPRRAANANAAIKSRSRSHPSTCSPFNNNNSNSNTPISPTLPFAFTVPETVQFPESTFTDGGVPYLGLGKRRQVPEAENAFGIGFGPPVTNTQSGRTQRRRVRHGHGQVQSNAQQYSSRMDVEEDMGRERKRVARR